MSPNHSQKRAAGVGTRHGWMLAVILLAQCGLVMAAGEFTVRDIRVTGLQRITEGTVYNYLPINIGDTLDSSRIEEAFRAVYSTGFFSDIEFRRDGDTLVIVVAERPSIESFDIEGNKDIKTEDLVNSLRGVGLAPGKSFDQSVLENVKTFLTQEYLARGKYGAAVAANVEDLGGNKVKIGIDIKEGDRARIRQINVVGNTVFKDEELRDAMTLKTPNMLSFYRKDDRYSDEALSGDIETLRSYYMDRGYANFDVESTQVAITPDKKDVYITINVQEGEVFTIDEVRLSGDMVVPEQELRSLVLFQPGQTFSRKLLTQTTELINFRLGVDGYARSKVDPIPTVNEDAKTVAVDLRVNANKRVYVRRVRFDGADNVNDEVFRRELRQMEGGWLSNALVDRSKVRLQRLPFVEKVEVETVPVSGSDDLVDVVYTIEEGLPGQFGGGVGYSASQGVLLNGNFTHTNFLGTGNRAALEINTGRYSKVYSFGYTKPYVTPDGISRQISLAYRDILQFVSGASDFSTETLTAGVQYGIPLSEYSRMNIGVNYVDVDLLTGLGSADQALSFVNNNGNPFELRNIDGGICGADNNVIVTQGNDICGTSFRTYELVAGWVFDSRDRVLFPTRGMRHRLGVSMTAPGSEVEYYIANYDFQAFVPIWNEWRLGWNVELAFGDAMNDTTDLPPFKNFFSGGPDSVRGFRPGRLGPVDSLGNPYGGNLKTVSQLELIFPTPEKLRGSTRFSLFYDVGNVFYTGSTPFRELFAPQDLTSPTDLRRIDYDFDAGKLRQSVGVAVQWLAPLGTFKFSYAFPLNFEDDQFFPARSALIPGDDKERFQFTVGSSF